MGQDIVVQPPLSSEDSITSLSKKKLQIYLINYSKKVELYGDLVNENIQKLKDINQEKEIKIGLLNSEIEQIKVITTDLENRLEKSEERIDTLTLQNQNITSNSKDLELENIELKSTIKRLSDSIGNQKSGNEEVLKFVKDFYSSLELTKEENQRNYEYGDVKFNLSRFNSMVDGTSKYPIRVKNLTGEYHDRYYISLEKVLSIVKVEGVFLVFTEVNYSISEMGDFINLECLEIKNNSGTLLLSVWNDVNLLEKETEEYGDYDKISSEDFYNSIDY